MEQKTRLKDKDTFTRADGLRVCHCAAVYSPSLDVCPNCHEPPVEPEKPVVYRKYLCNEGYRCEQGGADGYCCISCNGFGVCKEPCNTAEILKVNREQGFLPDQCEHMIEEEAKITYSIGFQNDFREKYT